jgi:hypothetical protein
MRTNKTQETPCIPTKSYACMSAPWSLDNVHTAVMQRGNSSSRRLKMGTCQLRENTLTEIHRSSRIAGGWSRFDNPTQKNDLSRNVKTGRARVHTQGCRANEDDDDHALHVHFYTLRIVPAALPSLYGFCLTYLEGEYHNNL